MYYCKRLYFFRNFLAVKKMRKSNYYTGILSFLFFLIAISYKEYIRIATKNIVYM